MKYTKTQCRDLVQILKSHYELKRTNEVLSPLNIKFGLTNHVADRLYDREIDLSSFASGTIRMFKQHAFVLYHLSLEFPASGFKCSYNGIVYVFATSGHTILMQTVYNRRPNGIVDVCFDDLEKEVKTKYYRDLIS